MKLYRYKGLSWEYHKCDPKTSVWIEPYKLMSISRGDLLLKVRGDGRCSLYFHIKTNSFIVLDNEITIQI